ncbi:MAG TPA: FAD-dependent oxidoreductase, partial [Thermoanaerobaculia bacterium]|nr:FAD-dependent oxidoreductase [Thermoanaerobaculia bacterium]
PAETAVLTGWAGGPAAEALLAMSGAERTRTALKSLGALLCEKPERLARLLVSVAQHDWSRDPYARGAYAFVRVGGTGARRVLARPAARTLFFAGEALEDEESGTVAGALASGRKAAERILAAFNRRSA